MSLSALQLIRLAAIIDRKFSTQRELVSKARVGSSSKIGPIAENAYAAALHAARSTAQAPRSTKNVKNLSKPC